jgi:hypothetical protein
VTPFESWYSSTIAPQLTDTVKHLPPQAAAALAKASKESMAACWNAALDAARQSGGEITVTVDEVNLETLHVCLDAMRQEFGNALRHLRVTP